MLQFDPKKRFSATELLKHPFIERYVGDFSYLDKKSIYNYVTKENLNINIKNTDAIESIINQYINISYMKRFVKFYIFISIKAIG